MDKAKKLRPRKHGRKPIPHNADAGVQARQRATVVAFDRAFRAQLPVHVETKQSAMRHESYVQVEGDAFHDKTYPVADGAYRVVGSDWIHVFEGGGYVESQRAQPPEFGGAKVIAVAG